MMFKVLLIGHLLGDFFFQSKKLAEQKTEKNSRLIVHCVIYFITILVLSGIFIDVNLLGKASAALLGVSILHGIIDWGKIRLEKKKGIWENKRYIIFLADQGLHIAILYGIVRICDIKTANDCLAYMVTNKKVWDNLIMTLLPALICWRPASIFVSSVFESIPNTILLAENIECEKKTCPFRPENEEGAKIGSWIGILEREIILILGI